MNREKKINDTDFDLEDMKYYMNLTAEDKLEYLEKLVRSLDAITPPESKLLAQKMREAGY